MTPKLYRVRVVSLYWDYSGANVKTYFIAAGSPQQAKKIARKTYSGVLPTDESRIVINTEIYRGGVAEIDALTMRKIG